jgi:hypothetical protein
MILRPVADISVVSSENAAFVVTTLKIAFIQLSIHGPYLEFMKILVERIIIMPTGLSLDL